MYNVQLHGPNGERAPCPSVRLQGEYVLAKTTQWRREVEMGGEAESNRKEPPRTADSSRQQGMPKPLGLAGHLHWRSREWWFQGIGVGARPPHAPPRCLRSSLPGTAGRECAGTCQHNPGRPCQEEAIGGIGEGGGGPSTNPCSFNHQSLDLASDQIRARYRGISVNRTTVIETQTLK